ncbi:trigger factor [Ekhidna lutea]|uniref:Trigger factor n=1 Tax=Ekhidna lutea TaxID=447679 RepID=A0A239K8D5_EKHLU|nr:trigger factor [Ekhidna lutea]SNT13879.1 trigger factor [Ekhidna lutea]
MDITFDKTEKTQGVIKISVNKADFQPGVDQKIKEYSKTANIKGFRKGKVPEGMIRKMYGNALIVEEINKLVSDKLNSYLKESDTQFLGEPLPVQKDEEFDWENQESFLFEYEIGFAEPFEVKVDKKVKLDKHFIKVDDKVIDETIENLQRQFGEMENPEVSSEKDTLYGQIKSKDGEIDQEISIDLRDVEKASLKKLVGIKNGTEVDIDPKKSFKHDNVLKSQLRIDDEEFKKLKKLTFTLKAVNHHKLAPVNQELFDKTFGQGTIKDEAGFRDRVKEIVSQNYKGESEQFFDHQVREKLTESAKINLPDEFLKKWLIRTNDNITPELMELEYTSYAKELKWSLIRNQIVKNQEIKVEHEDVIAEAKELIKKQFAGSGIGNQMDDQLDTFANNYLQGENGENYMKVFNQVQSQKVLDHIKSEVTVKEKTVSLDEFRKL